MSADNRTTTLGRHIDQHIGRVSVDISTDSRPMYRSRGAQNTHDPISLHCFSYFQHVFQILPKTPSLLPVFSFSYQLRLITTKQRSVYQYTRSRMRALALTEHATVPGLTTWSDNAWPFNFFFNGDSAGPFPIGICKI